MTMCLSAQEFDDCDVCDVTLLYHYRRGGHYGQDGFYKDLHFGLEDTAVLLSQDRSHADIPVTMKRLPVLETSIYGPKC